MSRSLLGTVVLALAALGLLLVLVRLAESRLAFFPFRGEDVTPARFGVSFDAIDVRTPDGETLRAWWMPAGGARAQIVYFHGNGGNLSVWSDIVVGLRRRGFSVLAVDYRGYGLSSGSPTERGLYLDVDATVERFTSGLRQEGVPVVYWGRSLGAVMAAYAASRRAPDGVVLEAGFRDARTLVRSYPLMWLLSWFSSYRFPTAEWMAGVRVPVLVLHGTADSVIPFHQGRRLFESLQEPRRFVAIEGGDHNDAQPRDPDAYWRAVGEFVASLER
jgi:fermentation-respiration switch protein FrsA (DUF1100 family)